MSIKLLNRVAAALAAALIAAPCLAADKTTDEDEATDEKPYMEEIIVTATLRETNLMDTPIAITVLDEKALSDQGIFDLQDMYLAVPGLSYRPTYPGFNQPVIRGMVGETDGGSPVGIYMDDMPVSSHRRGQMSGAVFDMARVEVLKGPQGTLFGEGAMSGVLRYITNRPDPQALAARVKAEYSVMDESDDPTYIMSGVVNVPLADRLALRVGGQYRDRAGFVDTLEDRNEKDVNWRQDLSIRARIESVVSDKLVVNGTINYYDGLYGGPASPIERPYETTGNKAFNDVHGFHFGDDHWSYNLAVNWDLGFADFLSSTSYFDRETTYSAQYPVFLTPIFDGIISRQLRTPAYGATPNPDYVPNLPDGQILEIMGAFGGWTFERTVQEFRLTSNTTGPWQWTAGLYYKEDDTGRTLGTMTVVRPAFAQWQSNADALFPTFFVPVVHTQELAAYGEATYAFNEQLDLTLGIRTANIKGSVDTSNLKIDETFLAPKVALTYRPTDSLMLYGTVAKGFRPGLIIVGVDAHIATLQVLVPDPIIGATAEAQIAFLSDRQVTDGDFTTNYEVGIKGTLADDRVRFTGAVYYIDWEDKILSEIFSTLLRNAQVRVNAGSAHVKGLELALDFAATDQLTLSVGGNYVPEAQFDEFEMKDGIPFTDGSEFGNIRIVPGTRMPISPEWSYYAAASYRFLLGEYPAMARLDWYATDEQLANHKRPQFPTPGYEKLDGRVRVEDVGGWQIDVFGKNLRNEVYATWCILTCIDGPAQTTWAAPRSFGISVQRDF
jgi:iron complex outermembrane receptor protein